MAVGQDGLTMANETHAGRDADKGAPPPSKPSSSQSAGYRSIVDQDFAVSILMEMQKSIGKMEHSVESLCESEKETRAKIGRIEKVIYAAGVVMIIAIGIGGWTVNAAKDFAMEYFKTSLEAQQILPQQRPPETR